MLRHAQLPDDHKVSLKVELNCNQNLRQMHLWALVKLVEAESEVVKDNTLSTGLLLHHKGCVHM